MSDREKTIIKKEEAEAISPLDVDLNKAIDTLAKELKGLEDHFDIKHDEDELGVVMVQNLKETTAIILASFTARMKLIGKLTEV